MSQVKDPKVSIITPSYNRAAFIEFCLESVKNQIYSNIEHIVIDGGSSDNTVTVLRKYEKHYNLKWISERDNGMYDAINKGINIASGDIIAYLNTDDAYFPWSVEVAVNEINKGNQLIYGDLCVIRELNDQKGCYLQFYRPFNLRYYTHFATIAQPTVFLRKDIFKKIGLFDTTYKLISDCEFWLRCAKNNIIPKKINEILAIQFDHGNTLREVHKILLQEELLRLRNTYRVVKLTDMKVIGRIENGIFSRINKLSFYVHYWLDFDKSWINFRHHLRSWGIRFEVIKSLMTLLPGFLLSNTFYRPIPHDLIMMLIKGKHEK